MAHALVGRSHGCDAPPAVLALPAVTSPKMDPTAPSEEIDAAVRAVVAGGGPVYEIRNRMVAALAPDVILTQDQCRICAVTRADVAGACAALPASTIVTIEPTTLGDVLGDVATIAAALGVPERGARLVASMERRLDAVRSATAPFPRATACHLEWLAPVMGSGYWIHELFDAANCAMVHGAKGGHCPTLADDAALNDAEVLVLAPCGFSVERTRHELRSLGLLERWKNVRAVREGRCYVADGDRFYNRSSCEVVETAEMTAEMAFPELRGLWGHHGKHFLEALRAEDFDAAFSLCSPKNRERLSSPAKFREICGGASSAALLTGGDVSRTDVVSASAATVAVAAGERRFLFDLAFEGGAWRTDGVRVVC
ncbi:hypothetical protein JL721_4834 [Aureococcus anophagefferens]|nr:hypothetical protein JL721_4834 [Aureococcus anophagefferens]